MIEQTSIKTKVCSPEDTSWRVRKHTQAGEVFTVSMSNEELLGEPVLPKRGQWTTRSPGKGAYHCSRKWELKPQGDSSSQPGCGIATWRARWLICPPGGGVPVSSDSTKAHCPGPGCIPRRNASQTLGRECPQLLASDTPARAQSDGGCVPAAGLRSQ